jgi:hypothetical protein
MFWVPFRVQVSYSHSGFNSENLYIGESSGWKLGFKSHSGSLSLWSHSGPVWVQCVSCLGSGRVLFGSCLGPVWVFFRFWSCPVQIPLKFLVGFLDRFIKPFAIVVFKFRLGLSKTILDMCIVLI